MTGTPVDPGSAALIRSFEDAGQGGGFRLLDRRDPEERAALLAEAEAIDLGLLRRLITQAGNPESPPPPIAPLRAVDVDDPDYDRAVAAGHDLLGAGKVAFYTVAGGQGTRLGSDGPKGCYPVGPVSGKTLFAWHAEKVHAATRRYGVEIPWVLMVSAANHAETRAHFMANEFYGLEGRVRFVPQRMLPAVDEAGKILLRSPGGIALSPNGHGGAIGALAEDDTYGWLRERGITTLSYFQVDNAPLNPADPAFLGYHALRDAEVSAKVVRKRHPLEKAGVVVTVGGRPGVVEYTEITEDLARATDDDGQLLYGLANIAAHVFSLEFLDRIRERGLPYHVAKKQVAAVDDEGNPTKVWGRKFETFIFDSIPLASRFVAFLTVRSEEFAPLKNAEGEDSPETVRRALLDRSRVWYQRAGRTVPESEEELEISPERGYDLDTFIQWNPA